MFPGVPWGNTIRDFAGGDFQNGGKEVVNAAAEGKAAAKQIHEFLMGAK